MSQIKVDLETLASDLKTLKTALETFSTYSKDFLSRTEGSLDSMNSDFIVKIRKTINNMHDTKAPELQQKLNDYKDQIELAMKSFEEFETSLSGSLDQVTNGVPAY